MLPRIQILGFFSTLLLVFLHLGEIALGSGPISTMSHLSIVRTGYHDYLFDLQIPLWTVGKEAQADWFGKIGFLSEKHAKELYLNIFGKNNSCSRQTACRWENIIAAASDSIARIRANCVIGNTQFVVCFSPALIHKMPNGFLFSGTFQDGEYKQYFLLKE